jgi:hypothetical protein
VKGVSCNFISFVCVGRSVILKKELEIVSA